jgi:hypothetical protein
MASHRATSRLRHWLCRSFFLGIVLLAQTSVGNGPAEARDPPKKEEAPAVNDVTIELVLPKEHRYKLSDKVDVEILFRNTAKEEVKIAVSESRSIGLFFAFLIVGDRGTSLLAQPGGSWDDQDKKHVTLVSIAPGATYRATVKVAFRLDDYEFNPNEHYSVLVIYRDYLSSHGQDDPKLWKGIMTSLPVHLNMVFPEGKD